MAGQKTVALVTGASAGLGLAFCRQLAKRCDVIIAVARRADRLEAIAEELAPSTEVHCVQADLCTIDGVALAMEMLRQKGPADYLVNNAGFSPYGHFADLPVQSQRDMINLHNDATVTLSRAAIPFMRERGSGTIINVSSLGALMPGKGLAVYGATKAFLNYFSESLQQELSDTGIRVQALCPGYTRTEFHEEMATLGFDKARIPPEYWMDAEDVVKESLDALALQQVLVVPGDGNRALARAALEQQLARLQ